MHLKYTINKSKGLRLFFNYFFLSLIKITNYIFVFINKNTIIINYLLNINME